MTEIPLDIEEPEIVPTPESVAEHIPTLVEVLEIMERLSVDGVRIDSSITDGIGLFILKVTVPQEDSNPNKRTAYEYMRACEKGKHPEGSSAQTSIEFVYYEGDTRESEMPYGGGWAAEFRDDTWVINKEFL